MASTCQSSSSTTTSMGNNIPNVWTPCEGTINKPSSGCRARSPSRPTILLNPVSATRMDSPRTVPRVVFMAFTSLVWNRMQLFRKLLEHPFQVDKRRQRRNHENAGENKEHQGKKQFHARLGSLFLGGLQAARTQRISEDAERVGNRCTEAFGLNQHGDKLTDEINIQPLRHAAPCIQPRLAGPLLAVDDLKLFCQRGSGHGHF